MTRRCRCSGHAAVNSAHHFLAAATNLAWASARTSASSRSVERSRWMSSICVASGRGSSSMRTSSTPVTRPVWRPTPCSWTGVVPCPPFTSTCRHSTAAVPTSVDCARATPSPPPGLRACEADGQPGASFLKSAGVDSAVRLCQVCLLHPLFATANNSTCPSDHSPVRLSAGRHTDKSSVVIIPCREGPAAPRRCAAGPPDAAARAAPPVGPAARRQPAPGPRTERSRRTAG